MPKNTRLRYTMMNRIITFLDLFKPFFTDDLHSETKQDKSSEPSKPI